jgi:hypothetical protein
LAVPADEGALGDVDAGGDARKAEAFGAQFEELVFSIVRLHGTSFSIVRANGLTFHWLYWLYWLFFRRKSALAAAVDESAVGDVGSGEW